MISTLIDKLRREPPESATPEGVLRYLDHVRRRQEECPTGWLAAPGEIGEACRALRSQLDAMGPAVERRLQQQVAEALDATELVLRRGPLTGLFPPVKFTFRPPPTLLVVSPRDRIEMTGRVLLRPELTLDEAEQLERVASARGVSAMVTRIGGLGVYPSIVPESSDLQWVLQTVAHEWIHQYLALQPLGWRYAFGAESDRRMVALNETVAELIGKEVGNQIYRDSYGGNPEERPRYTPRQLYFRSQMRELREEVDRLLKEEQVEPAEVLMERRRVELNAEGFYLRVLNQAYLAFHSSYAEDPYLSGPEGQEISTRLHRLRQQQGSLGAFARAVAAVGSYDEFLRLTDR